MLLHEVVYYISYLRGFSKFSCFQVFSALFRFCAILVVMETQLLMQLHLISKICPSPIIRDPASRLLLLACCLWWYHSSSRSRTPPECYSRRLLVQTGVNLYLFHRKWAQKSLVWKALQWKCTFSSRQRTSLSPSHTHTCTQKCCDKIWFYLTSGGVGWR